jgi:NAD-dependent DNA ligase
MSTRGVLDAFLAAEQDRPLDDLSLVCFECWAAGELDQKCAYCLGTGRLQMSRQRLWQSTRPAWSPVGVKLPLSGYQFAATGKLSRYTRDTLEDDIIANGGVLQLSVTRNTDFLIAGANSQHSVKYQKALTLKRSILSEADYEQLKLKRRKGP